MKIVPIESGGEPVEVLELAGGNGAWSIVVVCEGKPHRLSLTEEKTITIHDHGEQEIKSHEDVAELARAPGSACPCVRIKVWLLNGIYIIAAIP
ncbi:MAG: hypothetical protein ACREQ7_24705 [Candidatus Binatia bacterium]